MGLDLARWTKGLFDRVVSWLDERLDLGGLRRFIAEKRVPVHTQKVWYCLGGITLFLFALQVGTGILLLLYYRPSATEAYESVQFIVTRVQFGWVLLQEGTADWRTVQADFRRLEKAAKNPHQRAQSARTDLLRQIWLPELGRVDRCVTCLTRIGDKVHRDWLFSYVQDPHRVQPDTPMLRYRLSDDELRDLTAFLLEEYRSAETGPEPPPATSQDERLVASGRAVFERRGCESCHHIPGMKRSGTHRSEPRGCRRSQS